MDSAIKLTINQTVVVNASDIESINQTSSRTINRDIDSINHRKVNHDIASINQISIRTINCEDAATA